MNKTVTAYIGIDPTSSYLHIGHVNILERVLNNAKLKKLIILLGTYTCALGDPSDKERSRNIQNENFYNNNVEQLKKYLIIRLEKSNIEYEFVYNHTWLNKLSFNEWLEVFSHLDVKNLLKVDFFKRRIESESNLPLREFLYFTMQSYDFYYLRKNYNCTLQYGGKDQYHNMIRGLKLLKQKGYKDCSIINTPLIGSASQMKIGSNKEIYAATNFNINTTYNNLMSIPDVIFNVSNKIQKHRLIMNIIRNYRTIDEYKRFRLIEYDQNPTNIIKKYFECTNKRANQIIQSIYFLKDKGFIYKKRTIFYLN